MSLPLGTSSTLPPPSSMDRSMLKVSSRALNSCALVSCSNRRKYVFIAVPDIDNIPSAYLVLCVDDELPERLENDRVVEGEVVEADLPPKHVLDHVAVEEQRAELVLEEAQAHQAAHVAERVQTVGGGAALDGGVEAALARTIKEGKYEVKSEKESL